MDWRAAASRVALATTFVVGVAGCSDGAPGPGGTAGSPAAGSPSPAPEVSAAASMTPLPEPSVPATPGPSVDVAGARAAFQYPAGERRFVLVDSIEDAGVTIRDITYASVDGRTVSALLVAPESAGPFPAVLFLHWYATNEPDGDRTEFLDEAVTLAERGVVSLLPEQVFPWATPPSGAAEDRQAVIDQVVDHRIGIDILLAQPEVDPDRLAVVGHDFGGMYAALLAGIDPRVDAAVVMAGVPHFADWYLRYWHPVPAAEEPAYQATMLAVDPVTFLPDVNIPLLLQFAESDQFVNQAAIDAWLAAAPDESTTVETYASNHSLRTEDAGDDRRAFLAAALGLAD
jgi:dienelactone hydrolase